MAFWSNTSAFWSDPYALYPKQSHRWVVSFGDTGNYIEPHYIKSIDRPSYEVGSVQAKMLYSHVHNFPKRVIWKPIKIEFYDVCNDSGEAYLSTPSALKTYDKALPSAHTQISRTRKITSEAVFYEIYRHAGYKAEDIKQYTFKENLILKLNNGFDSDIKDRFLLLQELSWNGETLEKWKVYNPFIASVESGKLDYSSDNIMTISVSIVYDYAELLPPEETKNKIQPQTANTTQATVQTQPVTPTVVAIEPSQNANKNIMNGKPTTIDTPPSSRNKAVEAMVRSLEPATRQTKQEPARNVMQNIYLYKNNE